eukprot:scaffold1655_cov247-Pinguiococcus_pyrenoidosus.AAC.30
MVAATSEERRYGASRVEGYTCQQCGTPVRFPRYNDPGKLLETRRGRCGEWANCFTLVCISLGYFARYVLDFTDHVWTEVYSAAENRFLHLDSCEAALDSPSMYEVGWGKDLTYIFAFSKYGVTDVIKRYTVNFPKVLSRRTDMHENDLAGLIREMNSCPTVRRAWSGLDSPKTEETRWIFDTEQLELSLLGRGATRQLVDAEVRGRTSGDIAWRRRRGEVDEKGSEDVAGGEEDDERAKSGVTKGA